MAERLSQEDALDGLVEHTPEAVEATRRSREYLTTLESQAAMMTRRQWELATSANNLPTAEDQVETPTETDENPLQPVTLLLEGNLMECLVWCTRIAGDYLVYKASGAAAKMVPEAYELSEQAARRTDVRTTPRVTFHPLLLHSIHSTIHLQASRRRPFPILRWPLMFVPGISPLYYRFYCHQCTAERRVHYRYQSFFEADLMKENVLVCRIVGQECHSQNKAAEDTLHLDINRWTELLLNQSRGLDTTQIDAHSELSDVASPPRRQLRPKPTAKAVARTRGVLDDNVIKMFRSWSKNIAATEYAGQTAPMALENWMKSMQLYLRVWNVTDPDNQVFAATNLLSGRAKDWWNNLAETEQMEIGTLDHLLRTLRKQFYPLDGLETLAAEWWSIKQTGTLTEYRTKVFTLKTHLPLGEAAEFWGTYLGLKDEFKGRIRSRLDEREDDWMSLEELFRLARRTEIELHRAKLEARFSQKAKENPDKTSKSDRPEEIKLSKTKLGGFSRQGGDRSALLLKKPCWVCDKTGHFTRECPDAKSSGCFRCGGNHTLRDCPDRLKSVVRVATMEVMIRHTFGVPQQTEYTTLLYWVKIGMMEVEALLDTGAECSLVTRDGPSVTIGSPHTGRRRCPV